MKKKICAVIPARMASSRFPGKPLAPILGLPMIEHVRRRAKCNPLLAEVYVAACDEEVHDIVTHQGGQCIMTSKSHERCTDRVQEAMQHIDADLVVIIQGDEPMFDPAVIDPLVQPFLDGTANTCVNLISHIHTSEDLLNQDVVKAAITLDNHILYFSRSPIPFVRVKEKIQFYRQTGISCFSKSFLQRYTQMSPTPMEVVESVDFLRILEHGYPILAHSIDAQTIGVDRAEHVALVEHEIKNNPYHLALYNKIYHAEKNSHCAAII